MPFMTRRNFGDAREPNAVKIEFSFFDAIPLGTNSLVLETDRSEQFAH